MQNISRVYAGFFNSLSNKTVKIYHAEKIPRLLYSCLKIQIILVNRLKFFTESRDFKNNKEMIKFYFKFSP